MPLPIVNLVMIKAYTTLEPSVFDDTVHSVAFLLKQAGIQTYVSCNSVDPGVLNIIWGAGTHGAPPLEVIRSIAKPEYSIIFNMEQLGSSSNLVSEDYLNFLSEYRVFDYNFNNILELNKRFPALRASEFPVVPSPLLAGDFQIPADLPATEFDIVFWGAGNDRRLALLREIFARGRTIKTIGGAYGANLSAQIFDSRIALNIHFYESAIFEIARCLRPLAMGLPVVSEHSRMPETVDWSGSGIFFGAYDEIPDLCDRLLAHPQDISMAAKRTRHFISRQDWVAVARDKILGMA